MRVLLYDFVQSERTIQLTAARVRTAGLELVGWMARPYFEEAIRAALPGVDYFPIPYPCGPDAPLVPVERVFELGYGPTLYFLAERERVSATNMSDTLQIGLVFAHASAMLDRLAPEAILYSDVPHNLFSYCLYLEARSRGVRQLYLSRGPVPHLLAVGQDIEQSIQLPFDEAHPKPDQQLSALSVAQLERIRGPYAAATPSYMRQQQERDRTKAYLQKVVQAPRDYLSDGRLWKSTQGILARRRLRAQYDERAVPFVKDERPCVAVFLHLQPERTTCPEGGLYAQQWVIAHTLSRLLPDHRILVREHPSTFRPGPKLVRVISDYDALLQIPRVELLQLEGSPFEIIDHAMGVATVTGTVGFEALVRGTPVIAFGSSPYLPCDGAFDGRNADQLAEGVAWILAGRSVSKEAPEVFLRALEASPLVHSAGSVAVDDFVGYSKSGEMQRAMLELMLNTLGLVG